MDKQVQIEFIERYYVGYTPIVTIFKQLIESGTTSIYASYEDFKARIATNQEEGLDTNLIGFLPEDTENNRPNALYMYLILEEKKVIGWIPLSVVETIYNEEAP